MVATLNPRQEAELFNVRRKYIEATSKFDVKEQIRTCAELLAYFRDTILSRHEHGLDKHDPTIKNRREKKKIIQFLARLSSESVDYLDTVDFITVGALNQRLAQTKGKRGLSNEHMVPGEVIFEETFRSPRGDDRDNIGDSHFTSVDAHIWQLLWKWAMRRHPTKGTGWVKHKYFHVEGNRTWAFTARTKAHGEIRLFRAATIPIVRHVKIRGQANPFDPAWTSYFARRRATTDD